MNIDYPAPAQTGQLRSLWKTAFGDDDAFLDSFFHKAFSPRRCRCVSREGEIAAALYWFETSCENQKFAYLYAVATAPGFRGQGLCRALVEDTKNLLAQKGFHGLLLVPENEGLAAMYRKMGFAFCTGISEFHCSPGPEPVLLRTIDEAEYARLRRQLLPPGGVIQEGENLVFLSGQALFLAGGNWICTAFSDGGILYCRELLGNRDAAPGILRAMGFQWGQFRTPGDDKPFAMYFPLCSDCVMPEYFGLAFD